MTLYVVRSQDGGAEGSRQLTAGINAKLGVDVLEVVADRLDAQNQLGCHFSVRSSGADQPLHGAFLRRQTGIHLELRFIDRDADRC